jgi:hypothetical protein
LQQAEAAAAEDKPLTINQPVNSDKILFQNNKKLNNIIKGL